MGLDAFVRCRCFEEHKLIDPPVPYEDLYVDPDGYLWAYSLDGDENRDKEWAFSEWIEHACEHEDMEICSEWVGNWTGVAHFRGSIDSVGSEKLPILSKMLPEGNGGMFPAELAQAALKELDVLDSEILKTTESVLVDERGGEHWVVAQNDGFVWQYHFRYKVGMDNDGVFVLNADGEAFRSRHFRQIPTGYVDKGFHEMLLEDLDDEGGPTGMSCVVFSSLIQESNDAMEFRVMDRPSQGEVWRSDTLRRLLRASLETGNPIVWC